MTTEALDSALPNPGERVLLLNPPIYDIRFHWSQWSQPLTLLQLAAYAQNIGAHVRLVDALESNPGEALHRERVSALLLDDDRVNKWRFGQTKAMLIRRIRELQGSKWEPDRVYVNCLTTFWWEGAAEIARVAHDLFPKAVFLLTGAYGALAADHARSHLPVDIIIPALSSETSSLASDFSLCTCAHRFAYVSLGGGCRTALDVVDEIYDKLTQYGIRHFAFIEHAIVEKYAELYREVLELLPHKTSKAIFYALGNIAPRDLVQHPDLPTKMKKAGFHQIVFADDRHLTPGTNSDEQLIEDYRQAIALCGAAGFPQRTDSLVGSICIGRKGENLETRAQLATTIAHYAGSVIPWAYQPLPGECGDIPLENQNGKLFPLRGQTKHRDYVDMLGLAAILNAKYRERTFDFLGAGLVPRLLRETFARRGWDPDPDVKGSLVLPVRPKNAR